MRSTGDANQRLKLSTNASWSGARPVSASVLNLTADTSWPRLKRQWPAPVGTRLRDVGAEAACA